MAKNKNMVVEPVETTTEINAPYELPDGWRWVKQNEVCKLVDGEKISGKEYPYLEVKYLRGTKEKSIVDSGKFIKQGTKVILVDGENSGEVFTVFEDGFMGSTFKALSIQNVDENYLQFFISTKKDLYKNNKKGSAIPHLNKDLFFSMPFPLPPTLTEQNRIVSRIESLFSKLDSAKEKAQFVVDSFENRKAAILHKAFNGELTKKWRVENSVGEDSWVEKMLSEVCTKITDGTHNSPPNSENGDYMYITAKNIKENGIDLSNITFVSKEIHNEIYSRCNVEKGDVLYIKDGATTGIATVNTLDEQFSLLSSVADLKPNKLTLNSVFLAYVLNSSEVKAKMLNEMSGNAITRLTLVKIKQSKIPICSLPEQIEIVRILDIILEKENKAKEAAENVLGQIELLKKAILARAFRGEL